MEQDVDFPDLQPYEGEVYDNRDPEGLGRVRITIRGHWEPAGPWVLPIGGRNGGNGIGSFQAPPRGADVLVFFVNGARNNPRYIGGHHAKGEVPTQHKVTDTGQNRVWQDEKHRVEMDTRPGSAGLRVQDRATGGAISLEVDLETLQVKITGTLGVHIESPGAVTIKGSTVTINGRPVSPLGPPL